jgi:hypothetical protein
MTAVLVDFKDLFRHFHERPGMYRCDLRSRTVIGFITSSDMATGGELLDGFHEWLFARLGGTGKTSIGWWGQVFYVVFPPSERPDLLLNDLTEEETGRYVDSLFDAVDAFLAVRPHVFTSAPVPVSDEGSATDRRGSVVDFKDLFRHAQKRPGMYGCDSRSTTMIGFIVAGDMATGGRLLDGMHEWVFARLGGTGKTSISWEGQIFHHLFPGHAAKGILSWDLSEEEDQRYVGALFDAVDDFLAEHPHVFRSVPAVLETE